MVQVVKENRAVGIIPARGGSKGIPRKNLQKVGGTSLVGRCIASLSAALGSDAVFVTTDDAEIAAEARRKGGGVIDRHKEISGDTASSELAILHGLEVLAKQGLSPDVVVFAQCTSPFIDASEVRRAVDHVASGHYDMMFAAAQSHAFVWRKGADGAAEGINHTHLRPRQRRQDMEPEYRETGAFYVMNVEGFKAAQNRFFGRVGIMDTQMPPYEIDDPADLVVARALDRQHGSIAPDKLQGLKVLVMDFDGVHTDDTVIVMPDGSEAVTCSRRDGMGLELLRKAGFELLILSKEKNKIVHRRAEKLGIACLNAIDDKQAALTQWLLQNNLAWHQVAYIGNDLNDVDCLRKVGIAFCPSDAHSSAEAEADWVLKHKGGQGAVREVCDLILKSLLTH